MYTFSSSYSGLQPIEEIAKTPLLPPGTMVQAYDPVWGLGEFVYGRASAAIRSGALCVLNIVFNATLDEYSYSFAEAPNTANTGFPLYVRIGQPMVTDDYGWFASSVFCPLLCNASLTNGTPIGIVAAGQAGANTAGKQIVGARVHQAGTQALVKTGCRGEPNANTIRSPDTAGWFVGGYLSGTGVGAGAVITSIGPGDLVGVSVANTAAGVAGSVTQTANNGTVFYNLVSLRQPVMQSAIT